MKLPVPEFTCREVTEITPAFLAENGIDFLMLDLDNTIAPYKTAEPAPAVMEWAHTVKESGIGLYFVSNSKRPDRVERFAGILDVSFVKAAHKPSPKALHTVMESNSRDPQCCALIGDQIYTDVWAARNAGCRSILVHPIRFTNPFLFLRYLAEAPFRALARKRIT